VKKKKEFDLCCLRVAIFISTPAFGGAHIAMLLTFG